MSTAELEERRRISFSFSERFKNRSFFRRKSSLPPWLSWLMRRFFSAFSQVKQRWARLVLRWETTETVFWLYLCQFWCRSHENWNLALFTYRGRQKAEKKYFWGIGRIGIRTHDLLGGKRRRKALLLSSNSAVDIFDACVMKLRKTAFRYLQDA